MLVKHAPNAGNLAGVPATQITCFERRSVIEHAPHVGDLAGVPGTQITLEGCGSLKSLWKDVAP